MTKKEMRATGLALAAMPKVGQARAAKMFGVPESNLGQIHGNPCAEWVRDTYPTLFWYDDKNDIQASILLSEAAWLELEGVK